MFVKRSLTWKYFIAFFSMIMVPILVMGVIVYNHYKDILLENSSRRTVQILNQTATGIDNHARSMSMTLSALGNDRELLESLSRWKQSTNMLDRYSISQVIDSYLKRTSNYLTEVNVVAFYFEDGGIYYYGSVPVQDEQSVRESDWYARTLENNHKVNIIDSLESISNKNSGKYYVSAALSPQSDDKTSGVELIYISTITNVLDVFQNSSDEYLVSDILILDKQEEIIFSQQKSAIGNTYYEISNLMEKVDEKERTILEVIDNQEYMITSSNVAKTEWTIFYLTRISDAIAELNVISRGAVGFLIIILCLFATFSVYFLRNIVIPIKKLIATMKIVEDGNFDTSIEVRSNDELYQLGNAFNRMVKKIQNLIVERNLKEKEKNEAEMDALQSQINPHFIANTLSTIRFMAMIAKVDNVKEMTEAFINIVASSFNRDSRFHTIETEMNVLKSYIHIMQVRHGNQFVVRFNACDEVKSYYVLKMLIQPIVENAIVHGLSESEGEKIIEIRFKRQDASLLVEVEDNGVGIEEERVSKILNENHRSKRGFTGLGIHNVDQRIKLNHGNDFGLSVESELGNYTIFKIRLPLLSHIEQTQKE